MAIAVEDSFTARLRADTARDNLQSSIQSLIQIVNYIAGLSASSPTWHGATNITPSTIDTSGAPTFTGTFAYPGTPPSPLDYALAMQMAYNNADAVTAAQVNDMMNAWLLNYAPRYLIEAATLDALFDEGAVGNDPLSEDVQTALYTKAQNQINASAHAAFETAMRAVRGSGWEVVQPVQEAVLNRMVQSVADSEIAAAIEAYLKTYEIRVNHKQFCMKLMAEVRTATQSAMLATANTLAALKKFALDYASSYAQIGVATYEAQIAGFKELLDANFKEFTALVEANRAQLASYQTRLEVQIKNAELLLDVAKVQIMNEEVPYKGKLEVALANLSAQIQGLSATAGAISSATHAQGQYASAAEQVVTTIISTNQQQ